MQKYLDMSAEDRDMAAADAADIIKCAIQHLDIMTLKPAYTQQPDRFRSRTRWLRGCTYSSKYGRGDNVDAAAVTEGGRIIRLQLSLGTKRCGLATQLVVFSPF